MPRPADEDNSVSMRAKPPVGEKIDVSETGIQVSVPVIALVGRGEAGTAVYSNAPRPRPEAALLPQKVLLATATVPPVSLTRAPGAGVAPVPRRVLLFTPWAARPPLADECAGRRRAGGDRAGYPNEVTGIRGLLIASMA